MKNSPTISPPDSVQRAWFLQDVKSSKLLGLNDMGLWDFVDTTAAAMKFHDKESAEAFNINWKLQYPTNVVWKALIYGYIPQNARKPQTKCG